MRCLARLLLPLLFFTTGAAWADAEADFRQGMTLYQSGDYAAAFTSLRKAGIANHGPAAFNMGVMFENHVVQITEDGLPDYDQSAYWYDKAARAGHPRGQYRIGLHWMKGRGVPKKLEAAMHWFRASAKQGYQPAKEAVAFFDGGARGSPPNVPNAQVQMPAKRDHSGIAHMLLGDEEIKQATFGTSEEQRKAYRKAAYHYEQAFAKGEAAAADKLAQLYALQDYGMTDYVKAYEWQKKGAQAGFARSQYAVARYYEHGVGTRQDTQKAIYWYEQAKKNGDPRAADRLAELKNRQSGQFNATDKKLGESHYELGKAFINSSPKEAIDHLVQAVSYGNADAALHLAVMYEKGKHVPKDQTKAHDYYVKAAMLGHVDAQYLMGLKYLVGYDGVAKNRAEAVKFLKMAAKQGYKAAQKQLRDMNESW